MSTQRKLIRQKIAELLTDETAAGASVFTNRVVNVGHSELPALIVYSDGEDEPEIYSDGPREYKRRARIAIELLVQAGSNPIDDDLDDLAEEVQRVLFCNPWLDGEAAGLELGAVEGPTIEADGRVLVGVLRLSWVAIYIEAAPGEYAPTPDEFGKAHVEWENPEGDNLVPEAVDDVALETSA